MCAMNRSGLPSHSFPSGDRRDPENDASRGDESSLDRTPRKATPEIPADFKCSDLTPPAPPSGSTERETCVGDAGPQRPSLGDAILKVYKAPHFISTLVKLVSEGGPPRILGLWGACEEILNSGPSNRAAIVSDIVGAVARYYKTNPVQVVVSPPTRLIGEMLRHHPAGGLAVLQHCKGLCIKPIDVVAIPEVLRAFDGEVLFTMVRANYVSAIADLEQHESLERVVRHIALKRDGSSLAMCSFIRGKYEGCRGWMGKEAEAEFLWKVRDELTSLFMTSSLACEANLKVSLMYLREIPHPALDRVPQELLNTERWLLEYPSYLQEAFGVEHTTRLLSVHSTAPLLSSAFLYLGSAPEATIRGVLNSSSKFDIDSNTLQPIYRALGLVYEAGLGVAPVSSSTRERPPRTWVSKDDELRFQQTQISVAFKCLVERYWSPSRPDRVRQRGLELVRAVMNEQPYAFALAVPSLRKLGSAFSADLSRAVREEAILTSRRFSEATGENPEIRHRVIVADGCGLSILELQGIALCELEVALQSSTQEMMQESEHVAFINAMRVFCATTPTLEAHARELIRRYPDTLGAGFLARYLFEVRDPDPSLREIVNHQSTRSDLEPKVWIQYAHAAVGFGVEERLGERMMTVFESHYERAIQFLARWNPRLRASYRMVLGSLYPRRIGEVSPLQHYSKRLVHSSLEARIVRSIEQIPGIKVPQDVFIPWAPAVDGVVVSEATPHPPITLLIDGEYYHSVNKSWAFRGFDGHSLLAKNILCRGGHPVIRVSAQLGEPGMEQVLQECILSIVNYLGGKGELHAERLVVDAPDDYTAIAGKVMFYHATRPTPDTYGAVFDVWKALQKSHEMHSHDDGDPQEGESPV